MKSAVFVATLKDRALCEKLKRDLEDRGFTFTQPQHTAFCGKKKGVSCTLFLSGKLVVQGAEKDEFIEFYLEPEILHTFEKSSKIVVPHDVPFDSHIGIDESGKGDFFGPLCIAGVYASKEERNRLQALGVQDSKKISDPEILKISTALRRQFPHHVVRISPKKYNELYAKFGNLNHLLAWGHATVIENLVAATKCTNVLIDQFADEHVVIRALKRKQLDLHLIQRTKGEEDLVVAAASILARAAFLEGLQQLSTSFYIKLPKGASSLVIKAGRHYVARYGQSALQEVGKIHFKTTQAILS